MPLTTKEIIIKNIISLFIGLLCLILGTILYCILIYDNKQDKTKYDKELLTDEIIYINGQGYENCITLPCSEYWNDTKENTIELDIGVRNLQGMNTYSWNSSQNVTNPKEDWLLAVKHLGTTLEGIVVETKVSQDGKKLTISGRNPGNAVIYLGHKSCGITRTILVTVVDWETWQKSSED